MILPHSFFEKSTVAVAQALLGTVLIHDALEGPTSGRIIETEAYLFKDDPASHAYRGKTKRNAEMFGPPGRAYIYFIYGMYHCFNVVTGPEGTGQAVLVRALEPLSGIELMQMRRKTTDLKALCSGPGKRVQAMGIMPSQNGSSLRCGPLTLCTGGKTGAKPMPKGDIVCTPRVGITNGAELRLRFYLKGHPLLSRRCIHAKSTRRARCDLV